MGEAGQGEPMGSMAEDNTMSEHEINLIEQTAKRMAWMLRGMVALIAMAFGGGVWVTEQHSRLERLSNAHEVLEKRQDKAEIRLESYQISTNQKFEALLSAQSQVLVSVAEMRVEMRSIVERIDRAHKNEQ